MPPDGVIQPLNEADLEMEPIAPLSEADLEFDAGPRRGSLRTAVHPIPDFAAQGVDEIQAPDTSLDPYSAVLAAAGSAGRPTTAAPIISDH